MTSRLSPVLLSLAVAPGAASRGEHGGGAGLTVVRDDPSDQPIEGATAEDQRLFDEGDRLFERVYRPSQGLGPVFIQSSCRACHGAGGRGPGSVTRMTLVGDDGVSPRADLARGGAVSGRANRLADGRIGRFGVKARAADLDTFSAEAFQGDMGLTSPRAPTEVANPDGLTDDLRRGGDGRARGGALLRPAASRHGRRPGPTASPERASPPSVSGARRRSWG